MGSQNTYGRSMSQVVAENEPLVENRRQPVIVSPRRHAAISFRVARDWLRAATKCFRPVTACFRAFADLVRATSTQLRFAVASVRANLIRTVAAGFRSAPCQIQSTLGTDEIARPLWPMHTTSVGQPVASLCTGLVLRSCRYPHASCTRGMPEFFGPVFLRARFGSDRDV